jgi:hypothetical protein
MERRGMRRFRGTPWRGRDGAEPREWRLVDIALIEIGKLHTDGEHAEARSARCDPMSANYGNRRSASKR